MKIVRHLGWFLLHVHFHKNKNNWYLCAFQKFLVSFTRCYRRALNRNNSNLQGHFVPKKCQCYLITLKSQRDRHDNYYILIHYYFIQIRFYIIFLFFLGFPNQIGSVHIKFRFQVFTQILSDLFNSIHLKCLIFITELNRL